MTLEKLAANWLHDAKVAKMDPLAAYALYCCATELLATLKARK